MVSQKIFLTGLSLFVIACAGCQKKRNAEQPAPFAPTGQPSGPLPPSLPAPGKFQPGQHPPTRPPVVPPGRFGPRHPRQPGLPPLPRPPNRPPLRPNDHVNELICTQTVEKPKRWGIFEINKIGTFSRSIPWIMSKSVRSQKIVRNLTNSASVALTGGSDLIPPQIEVTYTQKASDSNAERKFISKASIDQGLAMRLFDESTEQEVLVDCYLKERVQPIALVGNSISCEGTVKSPDGKTQLPISKSYPWTGADIVEDWIPLDQHEADTVGVFITPQFGGQSAVLEVVLDLSNIRLSTSTVSAITNTKTRISVSDSESGFKLEDFSCRITNALGGNSGGQK